MLYLVDTCGWIEWLTNGKLAPEFQPFLEKNEMLIIPTIVQFELYKWICRERDENEALEVLAYTMQAKVVAFDTALAMKAAEFSGAHRLAMADAIVYATSQHENAILITSDHHFQNLPDVVFFKK